MAGRSGAEHFDNISSKFYGSVRDTKGRAYYCLFLDLYKAYDSIHWEWMEKTLRTIGLPPWVLNVVKGLLHQVRISPYFGTRCNIWIHVTRGVRQGCPLSPLIFLVCYEPLLCRLAKVQPTVDRHAFADDLAVGSYNLDDFSGVMRVMNLFGVASGLVASVPKCVMVSSSPDPRQRRTGS